MSSTMTKREGGIGLQYPVDIPLSKLPTTLSVERKAIAGLASRAQFEALRVCALDTVAMKRGRRQSCWNRAAGCEFGGRRRWPATQGVHSVHLESPLSI